MIKKTKLRISKLAAKTKHSARRLIIKTGLYPSTLKIKEFIVKARNKHGNYSIGEKNYKLARWPVKSYKKIVESNGEMDIPRYFIFEPTMRCNLRCDFCYQKDTRALSDKHELTLEQVKKIIDNLGSQVENIHLIGSEIFMRSDILDIIEYLNEKKISCSLMTNGTLFTDKLIERLLKCPNVTMIWTSIDGLKDLHNKLRGSVSAFDRTTSSLKKLSSKMNVGVNTVVMDTNLHQLKELIPLMKEIGVPQITFEIEEFSNKQEFDNTINLLGLKTEELSMLYSERTRPRYEIEELKKEWEEIKKLGKELGVIVEIKPPIAVYYDTYYSGESRDHLTLMCRDWAMCRIDCKGNVILCNIIKKQFGNLLEKPLAEIWNSNEFKATRMQLLRHNMSDICKRCEKLCHVPEIKPEERLAQPIVQVAR